MRLNEYQDQAQRTSNTKLQSDKMENGILGLSGEVGEIADLYKKYMFQGHELDYGEMVLELGDVLWYCAELAKGLGVTLEDVAIANIKKLQKRYPKGFEAWRSERREG